MLTSGRKADLSLLASVAIRLRAARWCLDAGRLYRLHPILQTPEGVMRAAHLIHVLTFAPTYALQRGPCGAL